MMHAGLRITYIGGPTAFLELNGLRLLTDPTFDAAGTEYSTGLYTLRKTSGPVEDYPQDQDEFDAPAHRQCGRHCIRVLDRSRLSARRNAIASLPRQSVH